jgi:AAA+ ATPase superfamily predicted ATPase
MPIKIPSNQFIGRENERDLLAKLYKRGKSAIVVVYGRRRVGKTALIHSAFADAPLFKFEGLEGQPPQAQRVEFLRQLAEYTKNPLLVKADAHTWSAVFSLLNKFIQRRRGVLYLEELQWMANYQSELVSAIKYYWDNYWQHNNKLLIVLCGSAPSFMKSEVLRSKALYNRSEIDLPLLPFSYSEARDFLGRRYSLQESMDALLAVGAIPPYLEQLKEKGSVYHSLVHSASTKSAYFVNEYEKIFTSSLAKSPDYRRIIEALSKAAYLDRKQIQSRINRSGGGSLSNLLEDLEVSGFITSYTPVSKGPDSKLKRYALADPYIRLYHKFIKPKMKNILQGVYAKNPELVIPLDAYRQHLAYSFERWLLAQPGLLAKALGFARIQFSHGPYFSRQTQGTQIDLVYERADRVVSLIEVKYTTQPVGRKVIEEFERKLEIYPTHGRSIERILVSAAGVDESVTKAGYFDVVLDLKGLLEEG